MRPAKTWTRCAKQDSTAAPTWTPCAKQDSAAAPAEFQAPIRPEPVDPAEPVDSRSTRWTKTRHCRRMRPDPSLPEVFTVADAVRAGLTPAQIETRTATGRWHRVRRGVLCLASRWADADEAGQHLLRCA